MRRDSMPNNLTFKLSEISLRTVAAKLRNKKGVYMWKNTINGKTYIGSSSDLRRRFLEYSNIERLQRELKRGESIIYKALLKYGYLSFEFIILESIDIHENESEAIELKKLELLYINKLKPDYNILVLAGSNRGHKLSIETRAKMSLAKKGLTSHRKGSKHSADSKLLMKINSGRKKAVFVYTTDKLFIQKYYSITECSKDLKISSIVIPGAVITNEIVQNKYIFSNKDLENE